jgi:hypothetical protein
MFNCNCYKEPGWMFTRIVNKQKYVDAIVAICGSGSNKIFYAIPQFAKFHNISCLKFLIEVLFQKGFCLFCYTLWVGLFLH